MLSQPSVSLQIQALELEFKAKLFQRRGPKIQLTPEGQALYKLAWPLVEAVDSLTTTFHASQSGIESGRLTIAAGESTILYILPETIKQYAAAHPGIELRLQNVTGRDGLKMLRNDAVDFAVGSMIEVPEDISYTPDLPLRPHAHHRPGPSPGRQAQGHDQGRGPVSLDPAPPAPDHLARGRLRLPQVRSELPRGARGGGLGGHQALRRRWAWASRS